MTLILGGGISGLSAAYYALKEPKVGSIILLEASKRLGGWIRSQEPVEGVVFEQGPRTIRSNNPAGRNTLNLIESLQLSDKVHPIKFDHPVARNRLIYVNRELHLIPTSIKGLFRTQSPFKRPLITMFWNDLTAPKLIKDDESIYHFVERRLGPEVAEYLISSMICGICAGDARQISVKFLMKSMFEAEQEYGSIIRGTILKQMKMLFSKSIDRNKDDEMLKSIIKDENNFKNLSNRSKRERWSVWGLKGGLEQLPIKLANSLSVNYVDLKLNSKCERLCFKPDHIEYVVNGEVHKCSQVISSISAKDLATLLQDQHPHLAKELHTVPLVTVSVVNLEFSGKLLPIEAFGLLVPPIERIPILGIIFDSCIFPKDSSTVLTVMMGGAWFKEYFGEYPSEEHLLSVALSQVKRILHITDEPKSFNVSILRNCIPQYVVGHQNRISQIRNYISAHKLPLTLCGSSYDGVGLNDAILSAKQAVSDIMSEKID